MRIQEAVVLELQQTTSATYAICGTRIYWNAQPKNTTIPMVRIRKANYEPMLAGIPQARTPGTYTVEVIAIAKSQDGAADLAEAVASDLVGFSGVMPNTSPATAGAIDCKVYPLAEEDLVDEEMLQLGLFAEARSYSIVTRY